MRQRLRVEPSMTCLWQRLASLGAVVLQLTISAGRASLSEILTRQVSEVSCPPALCWAGSGHPQSLPVVFRVHADSGSDM